AEAESDGIIQFSTGGAEFGSGLGGKKKFAGARALAALAQEARKHSASTVALPPTTGQREALVETVPRLLPSSKDAATPGERPLFQSHMWDGSAVPIDENLEIAQELLAKARAANIILEVEIGVVGGEEDGVEAKAGANLYTTEEDFQKTVDALGTGENGRYLLAATFGNVHGVYKPGNVQLRPEILDMGQKVAEEKLGLSAGSNPFDFVFHGGSGSEKEKIEESLRYGVIKMNVDTDTQYAFTNPIARHMFSNYDGVFKIDGEVGNKKVYDPRSYLKKAEQSMAERVIESCHDLKSVGKSVTK